jgi:hypothetical protein
MRYRIYPLLIEYMLMLSVVVIVLSFSSIHPLGVYRLGRTQTYRSNWEKKRDRLCSIRRPSCIKCPAIRTTLFFLSNFLFLFAIMSLIDRQLMSGYRYIGWWLCVCGQRLNGLPLCTRKFEWHKLVYNC